MRALLPLALLLLGAAPPTLDAMDSVGPWEAKASDGVSAAIGTITGHAGKALRLDWDFHQVSGYAYVRRPLPLDLPENYAIGVWVRWTGGVNNLEFKLVDASGENVWWVSRPDIQLKPGWQRLVFRKRDIRFAWGPTDDRVLRKAASIEFVVSRGRDGGKGSVDVDDLDLIELPAVAAALPAPALSAPDGDASRAMDASDATAWRGKGPLTVDFGGGKEFGGVILHWLAPPPAYAIETSTDGRIWHRRRRVIRGDGGEDPIALPETEARYLRVVPDGAAALAEISVQPLDWGATTNAFIAALAARAPRGTHPRGLSGEQSYWTLIATDGGSASGLIGEDGAVEVAKGGFSIEPFVETGGRRIGWAEAEATQSLAEGYLPIPSVTWTMPGWSLETRAFADQSVAKGRVMLRYTVRNTGKMPLKARLVLAVRPFQVNPAAQFLSQQGGVSPITAIHWNSGVLRVAGAVDPRSGKAPVTPVLPVEQPGDVVLASFDAGGALERQRRSPATASGDSPASRSQLCSGSAIENPLPAGEGRAAKAARGEGERRGTVAHRPHPSHACGAGPFPLPLGEGEILSDETGLASAALVYPVTIAPGGSSVIRLAIPVAGAAGTAPGALGFDRAERATAGYWRERLNRVAITVPPSKQALADTLRTSLAHILMSRDGTMLRPGTRSYARSWIRDGAMIGEGLLRLGQPDIVSAYADWYTPYQFANGKIPCCVDFKGADPVPENDSQGEYIFLVTQLYRYTGDRAALARHWPATAGAERYMERLRAETRIPANRTSDKAMLYGLMPPSISHEGYSAKPQYSLWDDFWALRGYKDAAFAATVLGRPEAAEIARHRDEFQTDIHAAIAAAARHWRIDHIPGATSLGDFDATSTTVAIDPGGEAARLDPGLLAGTFDRYWREFLDRRDGRRAWQDYTPYEIRTVSAMIRLGHRERVDPLLDYFLADRRPAAWNGWAEVVGRDPRAVRFIGDMPHAWISSDFIRAALDMFAYERPDDNALVLGTGLSDAWLGGTGSAIRGLRTPHGTLDLAIRATPARLFVAIGGTARPPGGFVLPWPWKTPPGAARVDGRPATFTGGALTIPVTGRPIRIEVGR